MASILKTNGEIVPLEDVSLKSLQSAVGGLIEMVLATEGRIMFVNEEGKLLGLPVNEQATKIYAYREQQGPIAGDAVVGTEAEFAETEDEPENGEG